MVRGEKCGLGKNPKSETICLTFSPSRFRLAGGNSLSISGRGTAREKQFKLLAFGLLFIGQVKRPIWIQTDIYRWLLEIFEFLLHATVALDQRKQKYTAFLKFLF